MRIRPFPTFVLCTVCGLASATAPGACWAADPAGPSPSGPSASAPAASAASSTRSPDEQAIHKTAEAFEAAYRAKNAKAIAEQYTADGEIVDTEGNVVRGRAAIAAEFQHVFQEQPDARITVSISALRLIAPNVAIEEGTTRFVPAHGQPTVYTRYVAVQVKQEGRWLVGSTRDLVPTTDIIPISERLRPLEFLIGDWVDESSEAVIATSYRWGAERKFMTHEFTVKRAGEPVLKGTQRIGWDPLTKTIKSWTFDSRGGHGEGVWTWDHNHWLVKLTGVSGLGVASSATAILTRLSKDAYRWQSTQRVMGAEPAPDLTITVVRRPPEPGQPLSRAPARGASAAGGRHSRTATSGAPPRAMPPTNSERGN